MKSTEYTMPPHIELRLSIRPMRREGSISSLAFPLRHTAVVESYPRWVEKHGHTEGGHERLSCIELVRRQIS